MIDPAEIAAFRFGTGLPLGQGAPRNPRAMLALLAGLDAGLALWPAPPPQEVLDLHARCAAGRRLARGTPPRSAERKAFVLLVKEVLAQQTLFLKLQIARAIDSPDGFRERLVRFWGDHFTTLARLRDHRGLTASRFDHAIRPHVGGRFIDLLQAAELHPSMLLALDQMASVGPNSRIGQRKGLGLNENLAREMMELHTLGVGTGYSQDDVRQLAELLTGLGVREGEGLAFTPGRVEPGAEIVLGQSYAGEGLAPILQVMADLARRPETARHLARKLAVHFLSDTPDEGLVDRMATAYLDADTAMRPMLRVLLTDPSALRPPLRKARQPFDFLVASLRALGVTGAEVMALGPKPFRRMIREPLAVMGQDWDAPRGPDGWPENAESWITPQGLAARIGWAMDVPGRLRRETGLPPAEQVLAQGLGTLTATQGGDGLPLPALIRRAETPREAVGIVLASPVFNRR
ncbi:DUF1800 domain-containing protein [Gemmobacter caeruleus]|uniref:DUF1800 domain-containing protein n=1 Tax=Gemmobacter caeruleus TaxID=2595004 RepID=UPI0011EF2531|nr:DUF1800 domain-containing protein [Gemmobacter caeruleus]